MRRYLLLSLMLVLTLLSAASVLITAHAVRDQELAVDSIMRSYVWDLSEGVLDGLTGDGEARGRTPYGRGRMMRLRLLSMMPALRREGAGGVLVLTPDGRLLASSPGGETLKELYRDDLPTEEAVEVRDAEGDEFYLVLRKSEQGMVVLTAVSRTYLLGSMIGLWRFQKLLALAASVAAFVGMLVLWRYLVAPLRRIVGDIRRLKWGWDRAPMSSYKGLFEIEALSVAIEELADRAVERTELKARYLGDVVRIQEESRGRLARELHDGPLQGVVAAIKHIQLARDSFEASEALRSAEEVTQSAAIDIRNCCDELSPSWVRLGLSAAMYENADRLSRTFGVEVEVSGGEDGERFAGVSEAHVLALVRILQEAVSNSARHGGASRVTVALSGERGCLHVLIEDDGQGFAVSPEGTDYERLRTTGHRGLANIHERVQLLQGTLKLESEPGKGCRIEIELPEPAAG